MKSRRSASGSCTECVDVHSEQAIRQWYTFFICMVDCCRIYDLDPHVYFG
jgi:hypothetical protein